MTFADLYYIVWKFREHIGSYPNATDCLESAVKKSIEAMEHMIDGEMNVNVDYDLAEVLVMTMTAFGNKYPYHLLEGSCGLYVREPCVREIITSCSAALSAEIEGDWKKRDIWLEQVGFQIEFIVEDIGERLIEVCNDLILMEKK